MLYRRIKESARKALKGPPGASEAVWLETAAQKLYFKPN